MEKIEVGEYVKTEDGKIRKIKKFYINNVTVGHGMQQTYYYCGFYDGSLISSESYFSLQEKLNNIIIKHSKNIIDIIELYDYVNYFPVIEIITYNNDKKEIKLSTGTVLENNDIKIILTKEIYEKFCYRIGE